MAAEFPDRFVSACVHHYRRPTREPSVLAKYRRDGRSFPTDYEVRLVNFGDDPIAAQILEIYWDYVVGSLPALEGSRFVPRRRRQAMRSTAADMRVFAGPSDADVAALPHIEEAWCVAEFICAELGLRTDTRRAVEESGRLPDVHFRYGLMLDWTTRDVARRMARDAGVALEGRGESLEDFEWSPPDWGRYGLDPIRVALEHGAAPDELDELYAAAGLRPRGMLSPFAPHGRPTDGYFGDIWWDPPEPDAGFREIVEIRDRVFAEIPEAEEGSEQ